MKLLSLMCAVAACLSLALPASGAGQVQGVNLLCGPPLGAVELRQQRLAVAAAVGTIDSRYKSSLDALDGPSPFSAELKEAALDAAQAAYNSQRRGILEPLAISGNAEAMRILAEQIRDRSEPAEIRRWLELTACASARGDPRSDDELVRWYWHQRGAGDISSVQANRARALALAAKAAEAGFPASLSRIATYIAGDRHQYPANIPLARRVMEVCAHAGDPNCQEELVGRGPYNFGLSPTDRYFWLSVLAGRRPVQFARPRDLAGSKLAPAEAMEIRKAVEAWRPRPWSQLRRDWADAAEAVLAYGQTSTGADTPCVTSTPWCRGAALVAQ